MLDLVDEPLQEDKVIEEHGLRLFVDRKSYIFLAGTTLGYSGGLNGKGFVFDNPQRQDDVRLRDLVRHLSNFAEPGRTNRFQTGRTMICYERVWVRLPLTNAIEGDSSRCQQQNHSASLSESDS